MPVPDSRQPSRDSLKAPRMILVAAAMVLGGCTASSATTSVASPAIVPPSGVATPNPSPSPQPSASAQTSPAATITFNELVLDPTADAGAGPRKFTFVSNGPGVVSMQVVAATTQSSTKLCYSVDGSAERCSTGAAPAFSNLVAAAGSSNWTVTLASADEASPTVDLALSWPAEEAAVSLTNGRFQGSPNKDPLRSLSATFQTRAAGQVALTAAWTPGSTASTVTLSKEATAAATIVDLATYPAAAALTPPYGHAVAAGSSYRITLMNQGPNGARTSLSATIAFP